MVSALIPPFAVGGNLYQMVLNRPPPKTHDGLGSVASVVAKEVSLLSVNGTGVALIALTKLSFAGGSLKFRWKPAFPKLSLVMPAPIKKYGTPAVAGKLTLAVGKPHAPGTSVKVPG